MSTSDFAPPRPRMAANALLEGGAYLGVLIVLGAILIRQGSAHARLQQQIPLPPREFYAELARSQTRLQIVDVRTDPDEYDDTHVPGAVPVPGCDLAAAPHAVRDRLYPYVPTVVISADGDPGAYAACGAHFGQVRNLAGGMAAWSAANLPEDSGEWVPPRPRVGGGCL